MENRRLRRLAINIINSENPHGAAFETKSCWRAMTDQKAPLPCLNRSTATEDRSVGAAAKICDQQWIERNREAMASYDAFVEQVGLFLEDLRTF